MSDTTLPTWNGLFGALDFSQADAGRSVYSPAAYLADLLTLAQDLQVWSTATPTAFDVLKSRRPDIVDSVLLNGPQAFTTVPQLDIVNQVLSQYIAQMPQVVGGGVKEQLTPATIWPLGAASQQHQDEVRGIADDALQAAIWPVGLPFEDAAEQVRKLLALLKSSTVELRTAFDEDADGPVQWLAHERLGLSPARAAVVSTSLTPVTDTAHAVKLCAAYGLQLAADLTWTGDVAKQNASDALNQGLTPLVSWQQQTSIDAPTLQDLLYARLSLDEQSASQAQHLFIHQDLGGYVTIDPVKNALVWNPLATGGAAVIPSEWFDRVYRLLQLSRFTGLDLISLDLILCEVCGGRLDEMALRRLAVLVTLRDSTSTTLEELTGIFGKLSGSAALGASLDLTTPGSLFDRVYNGAPANVTQRYIPSGSARIPQLFQGFGWATLEARGDILKDHGRNIELRGRLQVALGVSASDLGAIIQRFRDRAAARPRPTVFGLSEMTLEPLISVENARFGLPALSTLYRVTRLADLAGLAPTDLLGLIDILEYDDSVRRWNVFNIPLHQPTDAIDLYAVMEEPRRSAEPSSAPHPDEDHERARWWLIQTIVAVAQWANANGIGVADLTAVTVPYVKPTLALPVSPLVAPPDPEETALLALSRALLDAFNPTALTAAALTADAVSPRAARIALGLVREPARHLCSKADSRIVHHEEARFHHEEAARFRHEEAARDGGRNKEAAHDGARHEKAAHDGSRHEKVARDEGRHEETARHVGFAMVAALDVITVDDLVELGLGEALTAYLRSLLIRRGVLAHDGTLLEDQLPAAPEDLELETEWGDRAGAVFDLLNGHYQGQVDDGEAAEDISLQLYPADLLTLAFSPDEAGALIATLVSLGTLDPTGEVLDPSFFGDPANRDAFRTGYGLQEFRAAIHAELVSFDNAWLEAPLVLPADIWSRLPLDENQHGELERNLTWIGHIDASRAIVDRRALAALKPASFDVALPYYRHRRQILAALQDFIATSRDAALAVSNDRLRPIAGRILGRLAHRALARDFLDEDMRPTDNLLGLLSTTARPIELDAPLTAPESDQVWTLLQQINDEAGACRLSDAALASVDITGQDAGAVVAELQTQGILDARRGLVAKRVEELLHVNGAITFLLPAYVDYSRDVFFLLHAVVLAVDARVTAITGALSSLVKAQEQAVAATLASDFSLGAPATEALIGRLLYDRRSRVETIMGPILDAAGARGVLDHAPRDRVLRTAVRRMRRFGTWASRLSMSDREIEVVFRDRELIDKVAEAIPLPEGVDRIDSVWSGPDGLVYLFSGQHFWTFDGSTLLPVLVGEDESQLKLPIVTDRFKQPLHRLCPDFRSLEAVDAVYTTPAGDHWVLGGGFSWKRAAGTDAWARSRRVFGRVASRFHDPAHIDAALVDGDGRLSLLCGDQYVRYSDVDQELVDEGYPRRIEPEWQEELGIGRLPEGWIDGIDAAVSSPEDDTTWLFKGDRYVASTDPGVAHPIAVDWGRTESLLSAAISVDAVLEIDGRCGVVVGDEVTVFTGSLESPGLTADEGYPRKLEHVFRGIPAYFASGIDAGLVESAERSYLFHEHRTATRDGDTWTVEHTRERWGKVKNDLQRTGRVDAALTGLDGRTYLFSGRQYVRYSTTDFDRVDEGYPRRIALDFPGLRTVSAAFVLDGQTYLFGIAEEVKEQVKLEEWREREERKELERYDAMVAREEQAAIAESHAVAKLVATGEGTTSPVDKPVARGADKPADKGVDKPADKADKGADKPADKGADKPADRENDEADDKDGRYVYLRYSSRDISLPDADFPQPVDDDFWNLPEVYHDAFAKPDAVFVSRDHRTWLFAGDRAISFDHNHRWWLEPVAISDVFPTLPFKRVSAAFTAPDGRSYLFAYVEEGKENEKDSKAIFVRYSSPFFDAVDDRYPKPIRDHWGKVTNNIARTSRVDAAVTVFSPVTRVDAHGVQAVHKVRYHYLFSGDQFYRYTSLKHEFADEGYPLRIQGSLSKEPHFANLDAPLAQGVDGVWADNGNVYVFIHDQIHIASIAAARELDGMIAGDEAHSGPVRAADLDAGYLTVLSEEDWRHIPPPETRAQFAPRSEPALPRAVRAAPHAFRGKLSTILRALDGNCYLFSEDRCWDPSLRHAYPTGQGWGVVHNRIAEDERVDAALRGTDGNVYLFRGDQYVIYVPWPDEPREIPEHPRHNPALIAGAFVGLANVRHAFVRDGVTYLLEAPDESGAFRYVRYSGADYTKPDDAAPQSGDFSFWGLPDDVVSKGFDRVDAVLAQEQDLILIRDRYFVHYQGSTDEWFPPRPLTLRWPGLPQRSPEFDVIRAAFHDHHHRVHLFSDGLWVSHDGHHPSAPMPISHRWARLHNRITQYNRVDAAFVSGDQTFLFSGDHYVRYTGRDYQYVDKGYPRHIKRHLREEAPFRDLPEDLDRSFGLLEPHAVHVETGYSAGGVSILRAVGRSFALSTQLRRRLPLSALGGLRDELRRLARVDAAFSLDGRTVYLLTGDQYYRYSGAEIDVLHVGYPRNIGRDLLGELAAHHAAGGAEGTEKVAGVAALPAFFEYDLDAAFVAGGVLYLFKNREFLRFDSKTPAAKLQPRRIRHRWGHQRNPFLAAWELREDHEDPEHPEHEDPEHPEHEDPEHYDYEAPKHCDAGHSRDAERDEPWERDGDYELRPRPRIDAAFVDAGGALHLFKGGEYIRYTHPDAHYVDAGYPRLIAGHFGDLPREFESGLDGAFVFDRRTYLCRGDQYVRYGDPRHQRMDPLFPQPFLRRWGQSNDFQIQDLYLIQQYIALARAHASDSGSVTDFLLGRPAEVADPYALLATLFDWDIRDLEWLKRRNAFLEVPAREVVEGEGFGIKELLRVYATMELCRRVGARPSQLHDDVWKPLYGKERGGLDARDAGKLAIQTLESFLGTLYPGKTWLKIQRQVDDAVNNALRDAQVEWILGHDRINFSPSSTPNDLSNLLLTDVEMDASTETSVMVEAIAAVQLLFYRYLMNLENSPPDPDAPIPPIYVADPENPPIFTSAIEVFKERWSWLQNYRVWEANRKVFLYPETYIRPELRSTRTPAFKTLQNDLLQGAITAESVTEAYKKYLDEYTQVSRLAVAGGFVASPTFAQGDRELLLFGHTRTQPYTYYFRNAYFPGGATQGATWDAWQPVGVTIPASQVYPVRAFGRAFVFWFETRKENQDSSTAQLSITDGTSTNGTTPKTVQAVQSPQYYLQIRYSFHDLNGQWLPPQSLGDDIPGDSDFEDARLEVTLANNGSTAGSPSETILVTWHYTTGTTDNIKTRALHANLAAADVDNPPTLLDLRYAAVLNLIPQEEPLNARSERMQAQALAQAAATEEAMIVSLDNQAAQESRAIGSDFWNAFLGPFYAAELYAVASVLQSQVAALGVASDLSQKQALRDLLSIIDVCVLSSPDDKNPWYCFDLKGASFLAKPESPTSTTRGHVPGLASVPRPTSSMGASLQATDGNTYLFNNTTTPPSFVVLSTKSQYDISSLWGLRSTRVQLDNKVDAAWWRNGVLYVARGVSYLAYSVYTTYPQLLADDVGERSWQNDNPNVTHIPATWASLSGAFTDSAGVTWYFNGTQRVAFDSTTAANQVYPPASPPAATTPAISVATGAFALGTSTYVVGNGTLATYPNSQLELCLPLQTATFSAILSATQCHADKSPTGGDTVLRALVDMGNVVLIVGGATGKPDAYTLTAGVVTAGVATAGTATKQEGATADAYVSIDAAATLLQTTYSFSTNPTDSTSQLLTITPGANGAASTTTPITGAVKVSALLAGTRGLHVFGTDGNDHLIPLAAEATAFSVSDIAGVLATASWGKLAHGLAERWGHVGSATAGGTRFTTVFTQGGTSYLVAGGSYIRYSGAVCASGPDARCDDGYPKPLAGNPDGLPAARFDVAVDRIGGKTCFLNNTQQTYWLGQTPPATPALINTAWGIIRTNILTHGVDWAYQDANANYLVSGNEKARYTSQGNGAPLRRYMDGPPDVQTPTAATPLSSPYNLVRLSTSTAAALNKKLFLGLDQLLTLDTQRTTNETPSFVSDTPAGSGPSAQTILVKTSPSADTNLGGSTASDPKFYVDPVTLPTSAGLDFDSANGIYYWEIFFHAPLLIAGALSTGQRFEDARDWNDRVFDPTATGGQNWKFSPFTQTGSRTGNTDWESLNTPTLQSQIDAYLDDPFDPHAIAALRPVAYQKNVIMRYIDNLTAWGDMLFGQYTRESINEARMLYVMAWDLLGPLPENVGQIPLSPDATYAGIMTGQALSQPSISVSPAELPGTGSPWSAEERSDLLLLEDKQAMEGGPPLLAQNLASIVHDSVASSYFFVPPNEVLQGYWTTVADRLNKIRNGLNLDGVKQALPLFQPPIDPVALVNAAAGGGLAGAIAGAGGASVPHYRFALIFPKAQALAERVSQLGMQLLSSLDQRDGQKLLRLQTKQEGEIYTLALDMYKHTLEEAKANRRSLDKAYANAKKRYDTYSGWITQDFLPAEIAQLALLADAAIMFGVSADMNVISAILAAIPQFFFGLFNFGSEEGGEQAEKATGEAGQAIAQVAQMVQTIAEIAGTTGQHQRMVMDWTLQGDMAKVEMDQITDQMAAADEQIAAAAQQVRITELQIKQNQDIATFYRTRFTSEELYEWMASRLSAIHYQTFQLALQMSRTAERAFHFERGFSETTVSFIQSQYWDDQRKGLTAGESLLLDLDRMETAFLSSDHRRFEIAKVVSLLVVDPMAFLGLKSEGVCEFELGEALFDYDFPGHYCRQVCSIAVSMNFGDGVFVNAMLTQLSNKVVLEPDPKAVGFLLDPKENPPLTIRQDWRPSQQVALSHPDEGQKNNGMFWDPLFDRDRYLPFEGTGAVSRWRLELSGRPGSYDLTLLSDVTIDLKYTALQGGDAFAAAVKGLLRPVDTFRAFHLATDFADAWTTFLQGTSDTLQLNLRPAQFPGMTSNRIPYIFTHYVTTTPGAASFTLDTGGSPLDLSEGKRVSTSGLSIRASGTTISLTLKGDGTQMTDAYLLMSYKAGGR